MRRSDALDWMKRVINRNRNAHANTIIYFPFVETEKKWNGIYELCIHALEKMKVKHDMNGPVWFARKVNLHVTWGQEQDTLEYPPVPCGPGTAFRIVRVVDSDVCSGMVHYVETWYTRELYEDHEDEIEDLGGETDPLL